MKFPKDALSFMNDTHRELEQGESQIANGLKALYNQKEISQADILSCLKKIVDFDR